MLLLILFCFTLCMAVKIMAYRNATTRDSIWNYNKQCKLVTYVPYYSPYGGIGRVLRLYSNEAFFIVYDASGNKIRSSAWYFWQAQFADVVASEWHGGHAIYPTSDGWAGWYIPECG
ncbi:hypothetical protein PT300_11295 [Enterobacteriaceae bacterium ESL0689]|nr:hypothetical protein [Enterobacteriaceae bacterium ESL0689]